MTDRERAAALSADIGTALTRRGTLKEVLQRCADAMVTRLDAAFARVWVLNSETSTLELLASAGLYTHLDGPHGRVPVGKFKIGLIAEERKPHLTNQVIGDPRVGDQEWARKEGMTAFAGYPLIVDGVLVGVCAMFARHELAPAVLEALEPAANGIALAIQRKWEEDALRLSEARKAVLLEQAETAQRSYRELAEAMPQQVWTAQPTGELDYVNRRVTEYFGTDAASLLGTGWTAGVHPADLPSAVERWTASLASGAAYEVEFRLRRASDRMYRWHLGRAVPMRAPDGAILRWLGTSTDIHERKTSVADLELAKSEAEAANQAKSQFLASMSHELRTPLNAVIGYSEMLQEEAAELGLAKLIPDLQKIRRAGGYLLSLINNILDLSKIEAGKIELFVESFDLAALVRDVAETAEPLMRRNGNRLTVETGEPSIPMRSDATKLRQCLLNLLSNSAKFTSGGTVSLSVACVSGNSVRIGVSDTGAGIAPEKLPLLFEPFAQAHSAGDDQAGTGLGLAITRRLCCLMGGDVVAASVPGQGSTFNIVLPLTAPNAPVELPRETSAKVRLERQGRLVLMVDDDAGARDLMLWFLEREGYSAAAAVTGAAALRLAKEIHPRLITLDVKLPDMDGWEVLRALKADPSLARIPVIVVSIVDDDGRARELGAAAHLTKPYDRRQLAALLEEHCREPAAKARPAAGRLPESAR